MNYDDVIADLRRIGDRYHEAAAQLQRLSGSEDRPMPGRSMALSKRAAKLKARLTGSSGTSALVMAVMRGGADTLVAIAKDCKVKPGQARTALLALEDAGRVKRVGRSRATRYLLTNDK